MPQKSPQAHDSSNRTQIACRGTYAAGFAAATTFDGWLANFAT